VDQASILKVSGCDGNCLATTAQHICDEFLRHDKFIGSCTVVNQEQPAAKAFLEHVHSVTSCGQRDLCDESLGVPQQHALKSACAHELIFENPGVHSERFSGNSHDGAIGCGMPTQE
jgi:hypothetical protein